MHKVLVILRSSILDLFPFVLLFYQIVYFLMIFLQILQTVDIQIVKIINIIILFLNIPLQILISIFISNDIILDLLNHPNQPIITNSFKSQHILLLLDLLLAVSITLQNPVLIINELLQFTTFLLYSSIQLLQLLLPNILFLLDIFDLHSLVQHLAHLHRIYCITSFRTIYSVQNLPILLPSLIDHRLLIDPCHIYITVDNTRIFITLLFHPSFFP